MIKFSKRLDSIPPYLFAQLDRFKAEKIKQGVDVISLGIGDPDTPTADFIIEAVRESVKDPKNHVYPSNDGAPVFRKAAADYYKKRFDCKIDPEKEVLPLLGSKEGIAHISTVTLDAGDYSLVPNPGYPVYKIGAVFAGAEVYEMPLLKENSFLPDFTKIPQDIANKAKIMFLNYPNNPTAAVADVDFYQEAVDFALKNNIIICSDNSYPEIYYDSPPPSIFNAKRAKETAVEFYSLSKPFNMTGWRIAVLAGNEEVVQALNTYKKNIDSGVFTAIQEAGAAALQQGDSFMADMRALYERRMDAALEALENMGIKVSKPSASFYIWAPVPAGMKSFDFTLKLLEKTGVIVTPGVGFGSYGEGYFRISLTLPDHRLEEALRRMKQAAF